MARCVAVVYALGKQVAASAILMFSETVRPNTGGVVLGHLGWRWAVPQERSEQFADVLRRLVNHRGYSRNHKGLASELAISPSLLAQYLNGRTRPSFGNLLHLAKFFQVSLDFLIYGSSSRQPLKTDYGPVTRHIDLELQRFYTRISNRDALASSAIRVLESTVGEAVDAALAKGAAYKGVISEDEAATLEQFSLSTDLILLQPYEEVIVLPSGEHIEGMFLPTVAENIVRGRCYRFIVPTEIEDWVIRSMRALLAARAGHETVASHCEFGVSDEHLYAGLAIYRLDLPSLETEDPLLYRIVADFTDHEGELGYLSPPSLEFRGNALLSPGSRRAARLAFDKLWRCVRPI